MKAKGFSLVELLVTLGVLGLLLALATPRTERFARRAALTAAATRLFTDAQRCRELSAQRLAHVGLLFDVDPRGSFYVVVADGNGNGVSRRDYLAGRDRVLAGPVYLADFGAAVRLGLPAGTTVPAPSEQGWVPQGGIAAGRSGILSFSPSLGATPGSVYLSAGDEVVALRVAPLGALRLLRWSKQRQAWVAFTL